MEGGREMAGSGGKRRGVAESGNSVAVYQMDYICGNERELAEKCGKRYQFFGGRAPKCSPWLILAKFGSVWCAMAEWVFVGHDHA